MMNSQFAFVLISIRV